MLLLKLSLIIVLFSLTWYIMLLPGSLLQGVALYINTKLEGTILRKALMCPYCFAGQVGLWVAVIHFLAIPYLGPEIFLLPLITIPTVFAIVEGVMLIKKYVDSVKDKPKEVYRYNISTINKIEEVIKLTKLREQITMINEKIYEIKGDTCVSTDCLDFLGIQIDEVQDNTFMILDCLYQSLKKSYDD